VLSLFNITISQSTLSRILNKRLSYKSIRKLVIKKDTVQLCRQFKTRVTAESFNNIVCLDEVGFQLNMIPLKGWSKKGTRCILNYKKGGYTRYHGIFIINRDSKIHYQLYDKPINRDTFIEFIDKISDKDILNKKIVLDNLRIHHNADVKKLLFKKFAGIFWTPAYSPELNPVEMVFSQLKSYLRKLEISTRVDLIAGIDNFIQTTTTFINYYRHSWT